MTAAQRAKDLARKSEQVEGRSERLWAKGRFRDFEVFHVPVDLLMLNPTNRRFRAERDGIERELGRALDPANRPKDERSIISLLLDDDPHLSGGEVVGREGKDARALRDDWQSRSQERPLWIRPDGFVSNGNRRLAMLKRLGMKQSPEGYDYVDVIFLDDSEFDDDDIFEMEAREQLTEGLKVRYSDLNLLLTLRDAAGRHGIDWQDPRSIEEAARQIQHLVGNNPNYARVQLNAVKYMGEYLEYIGRPGEWHLLNRMVERFRDVGKNMAWAIRNDAHRAPDMLELTFSGIQSGAKHGDLREIRLLLRHDPSAFDALVREVRGIEDAAPEPDEADIHGGAQAGPDEDETDGTVVEDEDDESNGDDETEAGIAPAWYPTREVKRAIDLALRAARERSNNDAHEHVRAAANSLARVDPADLLDLLNEAEGHRLREAIDTIMEWAEETTDALGIRGDAEA